MTPTSAQPVHAFPLTHRLPLVNVDLPPPCMRDRPSERRTAFAGGGAGAEEGTPASYSSHMVVSLASSPPPTRAAQLSPRRLVRPVLLLLRGHWRRARERLRLRLLGHAALLVVPLEVESAGGGGRRHGRRDEAPERVVMGYGLGPGQCLCGGRCSGCSGVRVRRGGGGAEPGAGEAGEEAR